jgi:cytochrome c-type biogenesis protein CcmH
LPDPAARRLLRWVVVAALVASGAARADDVDAEYREAIDTILCDCGCHPQSIGECACGRAAEMREEVRQLVTSGMTAAEVVARYVESHGEQIRIAPTGRGFNLVAWLGPFVGLVGAGLFVVWTLRRWRREHAPRGESLPAAAGPAADDPYLERLRRELEELD